MKRKDVMNIVKKILHVQENDIKDIKRTGGMTNFNFQVTVGEQIYIVRIPGRGTDELVNRENERKNLSFAASLGINPKHIYFDVTSGTKITKKIENATTLTPTLVKNPSIQQLVIDLFQTLHYAKTSMQNDFKLFTLMNHYERLVQKKKSLIWKEYEPFQSVIIDLKHYYLTNRPSELAPCHIDPSYTNFIIDDNHRLFLIDWEYSGMFDPLWDLTAFSLECGLTEREEQQFLRAYFKREMTENDEKMILLYKIFQDYLWSLWTFYKESRGSEFGSYGYMRLKRVKENISHFVNIYKKIPTPYKI